ncbi:MAG: alpha/beta fold hydrolase [Allosphingosinicella sp.]
MSRLLLACALALALAAPAAAAPPPAAAVPIDQDGWTERKQRLTLPNGIEMAWVELGDPQGEPVLLLHGYTDSSRVWTVLAPWLDKYRLLIPDQRGHGASSAPECCYAIADFTHDAALFLDALGIERAAVVGHSMGSMIAQRLAAEHPERVTRIVLAGSTALAPVKRGDWLWEKMAALKEPISSNTEFLEEWSYAATPTPVDPVFVRRMDAEVARVPMQVWRGVIRDLADVPVGRFAAEVKAPVLILSGGKDVLFPAEHHASLVAAYPSAEARVFQALGHNLVVEQPHELAPVIDRFLSGE